MLKDAYNMLVNMEPPIHFHWVLNHGLMADRWLCKSHPTINMLLSDWLLSYGFEIHDTIDQCVATNSEWHITFSHVGDDIFVKLFKRLYYVQNPQIGN